MVVKYKCKVCGFTLLEIDNPAIFQDFNYRRELRKRYLVVRRGIARVVCPRCYTDLSKREVEKVKIKPSKNVKKIEKKHERRIAKKRIKELGVKEIDISEVE